MSPSHHCFNRFAALAAVTTALGSIGVLTACGESDAGPAAIVPIPSDPSMTLDAALIQGDDDAVRAHIIAGTPLNTRGTTGDSPLHIAAALGRSNAAAALIHAGAALEATNTSGATPLFNAAFFCQADVLHMLIDAGASTDVADQSGTTIRQIMDVPWQQIRPVYEMVHRSLGLPFDETRIRSARSSIAEMLR